MIVGIGIDHTEVERIDRLLKEYGDRFEEKVFTEQEIAYCRRTPSRSAERYAARFAAREAFAKAIGTGIRMGFRWKEVSVTKMLTGQPLIHLEGGMADRFDQFEIHLSLTHTDRLASAVVILEKRSS